MSYRYDAQPVDALHWPYRDYPERRTRPECDSCGPWASRRLRYVGTVGADARHASDVKLYRCEGCDQEVGL